MSLQSQAPNAQTSQYLLKLMTNSILSTIQICGFDIKSNEKEHKIQFNWSLFTRPNQKAFDVIVHFLLCQIDPEKAEKVFNQIWPVILKEQQKEFKDVVLNWLLEISQKSNSKLDKQNQPNQIIQQYQYVLHLIRFPIITKSLLMTPGGIKICELLFALCQYALIVNLARLIESNKLNIRIPPKVSPFTGSENTKQPFSQVQSTNTNNPGGISRIVNQKQMANYEILINSLKRRVDLDLNEFHQFIFKLLEIRTKWQQNSLAKTNNIRALVDKKIYLTQSLARKKALLARQLNVQETEINDENASLESLYTQFKEIKLSQFEKKWLEFKKINDESLENDFNKENIDCLISNTNLNCTENGSTTRKLQLDGQDFLNSLLNKSECDETNINDFENKILKFIYENMDRNSTFRNTEIGPLFSEDGKQLNLIK
ncbi:unnamed protein product [Brachionus calyciflorus]|uniref:HAUS augmin-like complex subunit 6 N-terminal domain-containing protein n=1 Tax=Brachionus calyciflorus TaxID=104777 RepID=A0A814FN88_9BILA|nr:unnamed protein product [Brachionus calyciflorus]